MKIDPHSPFARLESVKINLLKYIQKETQIRLIGEGKGYTNVGTKNNFQMPPFIGSLLLAPYRFMH